MAGVEGYVHAAVLEETLKAVRLVSALLGNLLMGVGVEMDILVLVTDECLRLGGARVLVERGGHGDGVDDLGRVTLGWQ